MANETEQKKKHQIGNEDMASRRGKDKTFKWNPKPFYSKNRKSNIEVNNSFRKQLNRFFCAAPKSAANPTAFVGEKRRTMETTKGKESKPSTSKKEEELFRSQPLTDRKKKERIAWTVFGWRMCSREETKHKCTWLDHHRVCVCDSETKRLRHWGQDEWEINWLNETCGQPRGEKLTHARKATQLDFWKRLMFGWWAPLADRTHGTIATQNATVFL